MPVADTNPERRNLVVSSLFIIIYYLGEGSLDTDAFRLPMVGIKFDNLASLVIIFWVAYFWFALRYWQTNQNKIIETLAKEMAPKHNHLMIVWFLKRTLSLPYLNKDGFCTQSITINRNGWHLRWSNIVGGNSNENGKFTNYRSGGGGTEILSGLSGLWAKSIILAHLAITRPGIGSYFMPYMFFIFAVALAVADISKCF